MVPLGRFNLGQLIRMGRSGPDDDMERVMTVSDWARAEAYYWRRMLPFCGRRSVLPDPGFRLPPWTLRADTDAAGGSLVHWGYGTGAVMGEHLWCYLPWGELINSDATYWDGKRLSNKMSAWELVGPLMVLTAGVELVSNRSLIIPVDNAGSMAIYQKGWCTSCMLCTTLALAISVVASSINCRLEIIKVRRCSTLGAEAADAFSKADFIKFRRLKPLSNLNPAIVPRTLVDWVLNPVEDRELGDRLLRELGIEKNVMGHHSAFR